MKKLLLFGCLAAFCVTGNRGCAGRAHISRVTAPVATDGLDRLVGQAVDITPWAYAWRADRAVQPQPEACFIPHRLERQDKVYRTAHAALPQAELKSLYYDMPDLLQPLPPQPKGQLQAGLLWTGGVTVPQVELHWPAGMPVPPQEAVEVRTYPTSFGWFGWTVDKVLSNPEVSADGRVWTYKSDPAAKMDSAYSVRVDAATEMVAVFCTSWSPLPQVHDSSSPLEGGGPKGRGMSAPSPVPQASRLPQVHDSSSPLEGGGPKGRGMSAPSPVPQASRLPQVHDAWSPLEGGGPKGRGVYASPPVSQASRLPQVHDAWSPLEGGGPKGRGVYASPPVSQASRLPRPDCPIPELHVTGPNTGIWKRMDVEIEWGFAPGTEQARFDGWLEPSVAMLGPAAPLAGGKGTALSGRNAWRSRAVGKAERRGIVVPVLYASGARPGLDSRITVRTKAGGFTVRISDLENGPVWMPDQGVFVAKAGGGQSARQFTAELAAKGLKSVRQMTREHREAESWKELMQEVRLWTCPDGTAVPAFPQVDDPPMQVEIGNSGTDCSIPSSTSHAKCTQEELSSLSPNFPDWTAAWRAASNQLTGQHLWGGLAFEVGRVAHEMDLIGLHEQADKVYQHFLESPGVKPDGDYSDGKGALEWATAMRHDMGYSHDGTHASTGRLLYAMAERYFLTGDRAWFEKHRARMTAAADWLVRMRTEYMKDVPNRREMHAYGLMPPCMLGDYAIPSCDWHWYYVDNALSLQGLQRFADALSEFDREAGRKYRKEAASFRKDLRRALDREAALAPVRLGRDGAYHRYLPRMAYSRGLPGPELGAPQFPDCDKFMGALPLAEPHAALCAHDPRMVDTLDLMEEMGTTAAAVQEKEEARKKFRERTAGVPPATNPGVLVPPGGGWPKGPGGVCPILVPPGGGWPEGPGGVTTDDAWFWNPFVILPKASHNANIYLLQDDIPNFLRFWQNAYASVVGADGKLWEHWHLGNYDPCTTPDNGTAGWFMENFRNLLVMEDGDTLWAARGTPRAWLEQGKKISVKNAPTQFGAFAYEIVSDVDHGKISATVEMPSRKAPSEVRLRLRHPKSLPIKSVTVNGKPWSDFDPAKEVVRLKGVQGTLSVTMVY